jgi:uncharacterized protein DUF1559
MSSAIGFKQQCPSCGGQITIKNPELVGKKVDCPKCKYRFVVEAPDGDAGGASDNGHGEAAPARPKKEKKGAQNRIKEKDKRRKRGDDDDDGGAKKGSNKGILIMAGVGVLVLAIVGVVLIIVYSGDDKTPPPVAAAPPPKQKEEVKEDPAEKLRKLLKDGALKSDEKARKEALDLLTDEKQETADKCQVAFEDEIVKEAADHNQADDFFIKFGKGLDKAKMDKLRSAMDGRLVARFGPRDLADEPTNMLNADTQVVLNLSVREFLKTPFGTTVFGRGTFRMAEFDARLGVKLDTVERIVMGANRDHNTVMVVVRTNDAYNWDEVKRALNIDAEAKKTMKGKDYWIGKIDFLAEFVDRRFPLAALRSKAAVLPFKAKTLIYGDEVSIQKFLDSPSPFIQTAPPPTPSSGPSGSDAAPAGSGAGGAAGPGGGKGAPGGGAGYPGAPEGVGPGAGGGPGAAGGGPMFIGSGPGGGAAAGGGPMGRPGGNAPETPAKAPEEKYYLTLDKNFRKLIDITLDKKQPVLVYADASKRATNEFYYFEKLTGAQQKSVEMIAMAVHHDDNLVLRLAAWCKEKKEAEAVKKQILTIFHDAAKKELRDLLGFEFQVVDLAVADTGTGFGPGGFGPGGFGGGPMGPAGPGGKGGGYPGAPEGVGPGAGGGPGFVGGGPGARGGGGGNMRLGGPPRGDNPGGPAAGGPGAETPVEKDESKIEVSRVDEIVVVNVTLIDKAGTIIDDKLSPRVSDIRAVRDIAEKKLRIGELGSGVTLLRSAKQDIFPPGALPRRADPSRGLRQWPANERVSWMRELLPFMGDSGLIYNDINPDKSWRDPENLKAGRHFIPQFVVPGSGRYYTSVRGINQLLAVTHFVGMAGVGPDAAFYAKGDPRSGMFSYDRPTTFAEVTDGLSNTIYMIQSDPAVAGPWIAGGGSTVRGTSEEGNDVGRKGGFLSPSHNGKPGAWAVMGDGSIRFISKDIDPTVFKALCTKAGAEQVSEVDVNKFAPKATFAPTEPKAATPPAGKPGEEKKTPPKKTVKEEDDASAKKEAAKKDEK